MANLENEQNENNIKSLRSMVFNQLQNDIIYGKYRNGENLIETKLSKELGVSRTPVREALTQLELEGLVKFIPNKGTVVLGISDKDIDDIYAIRALVEGLASRWAAQNISKKELEKLKEVIELEEFYTSKNDITHLLDLDNKFHDLLYRASYSVPLMHMLKNFHHYVEKYRKKSLSTPGRALQTLEEHKNIYQAVFEGDVEESERLTYFHINNAINNYKKLK